MKMNFLFYGFRHSHLISYYKKAAAHPDIRILAAVEENDAARAAAAQKLGIAFSDRSYEAWLQDPAVEVVAIGTAYGDRGRAVIRALEHGKHVLCDKPICTSLEELEAIRALVQEKGATVGCLLDLKHMPCILPAKRLIESGRLGAVRNISFTAQHCLNYGSRPEWYFEEGMHGGTINDIAIHGIDILPYLTGHRLASLDAARTWNAYAHLHPHFKDCAIFMGRTDGDAGVLADVSYAAPQQGKLPTYWRFEIWCDMGLISLCAAESTVTVYEKGMKEAQILPGEDHPFSMLDEFLSAVQEGGDAMTRRVLCATETALRIQAAADKAKEGIPL